MGFSCAGLCFAPSREAELSQFAGFTTAHGLKNSRTLRGIGRK